MGAEVGRSGPYHAIDLGEGRILRLLVGADETGLQSPCDIEVEAGAVRYLGVVATLEQLRDLMLTWRTTGECLGGKYLWIKNLLVVEQLDPNVVGAAVVDLFKSGEIDSAFGRVDSG